MMTVFVPVTVLNILIFCWIFTAITRLMEKLKETNQTEKLQLFTMLFAVLIAAIGVATLSFLVEVHNLSRPPQAVWKHQWILTDAVSHSLFLLVLVAMMWLWRPHSESQRYAFSEQLANTDMDGDAGATSVAKGEVIGQAHVDEDSGKSAPRDAAMLLGMRRKLQEVLSRLLSRPSAEAPGGEAPEVLGQQGVLPAQLTHARPVRELHGGAAAVGQLGRHG